jgi:hypothetical protein
MPLRLPKASFGAGCRPASARGVCSQTSSFVMSRRPPEASVSTTSVASVNEPVTTEARVGVSCRPCQPEPPSFGTSSIAPSSRWKPPAFDRVIGRHPARRTRSFAGSSGSAQVMRRPQPKPRETATRTDAGGRVATRSRSVAHRCARPGAAATPATAPVLPRYRPFRRLPTSEDASSVLTLPEGTRVS